MTRKLLTSFLAATFILVGQAVAQDIAGKASFTSTPNGPQAIDFNLTNADNVDSGVGKVTKINGTTVDIDITWSRGDDDSITCSIGGTPSMKIWNAPKELPKNSGGSAVLYDAPPYSTGSWTRTNDP